MLCIICSSLNGNSTIYKENSMNNKSISEKALDGYDEIINQYTDAIEAIIEVDYDYMKFENYPGLVVESLNHNLLVDFIFDSKYNEVRIYYALRDIDQNGVPELFIGGSYVTEVPKLYDIYVYDKTKVIKPFAETYNKEYDDFGHRTNIDFSQNGLIQVSWKDGGMSNGSNFYKLSSDGYSMEFIDSISLHVRNTQTGDGSMVTKYFHDQEGINEISEDEFYSIRSGYMGEGDESLSWIEIKP